MYDKLVVLNLNHAFANFPMNTVVKSDFNGENNTVVILKVIYFLVLFPFWPTTYPLCFWTIFSCIGTGNRYNQIPIMVDSFNEQVHVTRVTSYPLMVWFENSVDILWFDDFDQQKRVDYAWDL